MIIQTTPFKKATLDTLLSAYYNGTDSKYYGVQDADLLTQNLTAAIRNDPKGAIRQIGANFTCPSKFFGAHTRDPAVIAQMAAAGCRNIRLRDTGCNWGETVAKQASVTFTAGSTNTVTWAGSGADPAKHAFAGYTSSSYPSGLTQLTLYYIVGVQGTDTFQLSTTPGGAPISLGSAGASCTGMLINMSVMHPDGVSGRLDQIVAAASAGGMDIIYDCSRPPLSLTNGSVDSRGRATTPVTSQTYVNKWMQVLYARYAGKINYFEAWNEPNDTAQFAGTISGASNDLYTYTNWWFQACNAYTAGTGKVVGPSWNIVGGAAAMNTWLASPSNGNRVIHVVSCHSYRGGTVQLGYDNAAVDAYIAGAAANAAGKEIWITEVGESYPTKEILWRSHMYAAAKGVSRMLWYSYDLAAGLGDMRLTSYDGLAAAYLDMVSRCAGQTINYVNQCYDRRVGVGVGSFSSIF